MLVLFAIVVIDLIGFGLVIPLLPFYGERFGASPFAVTVILAMYSLAQLFAAPLWGRLSDRWGRRPILLISLAGSVVAYLWMGVAYSLWVLFAARFLQGAMAGNIAAAQAYVADVTTPENRAKGMGMIGAAFGIGFIIGPALGGLLAGGDPATARLGAPFYVGAGLSALAFVGALIFLKESLPPERRGSIRQVGRLAAIADKLGRPDLRGLILLSFLVILAFAGMEVTFAMWAFRQFHWGPLQVGLVFTFVGVISATMQGGLVGRLANRYGEARLLTTGLAAILLGLLILPAAAGVPLLLASTGLLAVGMGLTQPSLNSLISRRARPDEQGEVLGVNQSVGSFARIVGPWLAGLLFEAGLRSEETVGALGKGAPFFAGAALMAVALVLAVRVLRLAAAGEPLAAEGTTSGQRPSASRGP
jgi:DHA1 family tetracycline resistance protein-like MFS transporter